jgi:hypothetical protein
MRGVSTIEVIRRSPPNVQPCGGKGCGKLVEWVFVQASQKRMPVTHPLSPIREHERQDGTFLTVIEGATVHFSTCPAADTFRKKPRGTRKPSRPAQPTLFQRDPQ